MTCFEKVKGLIDDLDSLNRIDSSSVSEIRKNYPGIPEVYLEFLAQVGHGNTGFLAIYQSPIHPQEVYGEERSRAIDHIFLFCDDMQGFCYGFNRSDSYRVVEVDPRGTINQLPEDTFLEFLLATL